MKEMGVRIGVIADTHGQWHPRIPKVFQGVQHIIHAGDIGDERIMKELRKIAPVTAVNGNVDYHLNYPHYQTKEFGGKTILVVHVVDDPNSKMIIATSAPHMVIFGHTHKPERTERDGVIYFNPGAVQKRPNLTQTVAILRVEADKIETEWVNL
jgi:putative phosphoesterase